MVLLCSFKTERGCPVKLAICKIWLSSYPFSNGCQGNLNLWCNGIFPWGFQMAHGGASSTSRGIESPYSHSALLPRTLCTSPASMELVSITGWQVLTRKVTAGPGTIHRRWSRINRDVNMHSPLPSVFIPWARDLRKDGQVMSNFKIHAFKNDRNMAAKESHTETKTDFQVPCLVSPFSIWGGGRTWWINDFSFCWCSLSVLSTMTF